MKSGEWFGSLHCINSPKIRLPSHELRTPLTFKFLCVSWTTFGAVRLHLSTSSRWKLKVCATQWSLYMPHREGSGFRQPPH